MITPKNIEFLEKIVARLAMKDYKQANPKRIVRSDGSIKRNPYSLSCETMEAREMLNLARRGQNEESVKAYILKWKLLGDV